MSGKLTCISEDLLRRIRGEFLEMPGHRLTEAQAGRMWNLDPSVCRTLLTTLVDSNFLFRTKDGAFMRLESAKPARATSRPRPRIVAA